MEDLSTLLPTILVAVLALAAIGVFAGLMAGLLGIGGGIVMVPALFYLEGLFGVPDSVRMHLAVGTSLAVIIITSAFSVRTHWKHQAVDLEILKIYAPGVLVGVAAGTIIAALVSGAVLTAVFAGIALLIALNMAAGKPHFVLGESMPGKVGSNSLGMFTGVISTLAGIGGGALTVSITTLYSVPIRIAVGTASAVGVIVSLPAATGFAVIGWQHPDLPVASIGYVNLIAVAILAPFTSWMAPIGARLAHRLPTLILGRIFAVFLLIAAGRMFWTLLE